MLAPFFLSTSSFQKIWHRFAIDYVNSDFLISSWCLGKVTCWKLWHMYGEIIFKSQLTYTAVTVGFRWFSHVLKIRNNIPIMISTRRVRFFFIDEDWHRWIDYFCIFPVSDKEYTIGLEDKCWCVIASIKVEYWMGVSWVLGFWFCRWGFEHWGEINFHERRGWTTAQPS